MYYINWKHAVKSYVNEIFHGIIQFAKAKFPPKTLQILVALQKPMFRIKIPQILQGYFLGLHLRILLLKFSIELVYLSSEVTKSQIIGQKYIIKLEQFQTVFSLAFWNSLKYVFSCTQPVITC